MREPAMPFDAPKQCQATQSAHSFCGARIAFLVLEVGDQAATSRVLPD